MRRKVIMHPNASEDIRTPMRRLARKTTGDQAREEDRESLAVDTDCEKLGRILLEIDIDVAQRSSPFLLLAVAAAPCKEATCAVVRP